MDEWKLFHAYRNLYQSGHVKPITCPDHPDTIMATRLGKDDKLALWCPIDDVFTYPGLDLVQQVRAVVAEHVLEI